MSVCVLDYLTISIIPKKELENCSVISVLNLIASNLYLDSYLDKFRLVGRARHYAAVYRFNDISIKVPAEDRLYKQGVCVECTSNGFPDFVRLYKRTVMGHLRFINQSEKNRSRCPTCAWWIAFLDSVEARPLATAPVRSAQFKRSYDWAFNKCAPTLWGIMACMGTVDFIIALKEHGRNNIKARQIQLVEDYLDNNNDLADECENMWAFLMAMYDYDDYESALKQLKEDSFYIRNMPADCDSRQWLQMVFQNEAR